jgi:hypothetical protein
MKQQFLKGKVGTIRLTIYEANRPVVPSSAKITLLDSSGATVQTQTDVTAIDSTTGEMTYSLTAVHTATSDLNYKATWEYVVSAVTYYENQLFDVVKSILSIPITDDDLYAELNSLRKDNKQEKGTASSGTASTLVDTKRKEEDNYWKGGIVEVLSGTGSGQTRNVSSFTQSSGTINVTPNFVTNPDSTSTYRIVKSFSSQIRQSFEKVEDMLYAKGKRQDLILEASQIKFPLIYITIHFICLDLMQSPEDRWHSLAETYWQKFKDSFDSLTLEYDEDESGNIEGGEEESVNTGEIRVNRC